MMPVVEVVLHQIIEGKSVREAFHYWNETRYKSSFVDKLTKAGDFILKVFTFVLKFYVLKLIFVDGVYNLMGFEKTIIFISLIILLTLRGVKL